MSSIDWALKDDWKEWGLTILQVSGNSRTSDGSSDRYGSRVFFRPRMRWMRDPIWATKNFPTEPKIGISRPTKSSLYRRDCIEAASLGLKEVIHNYINGIPPRPLVPEAPHVKGKLRPNMKNVDRMVNWGESAEVVERIIRASDSQPGCLDVLEDQMYFFYGPYLEENPPAGSKDKPPKTILGKSDQAILIKCGEKAVWISHLKKRNSDTEKFFKLPASLALPASVVDKIPDLTLPNSAYIIPSEQSQQHSKKSFSGKKTRFYSFFSHFTTEPCRLHNVNTCHVFGRTLYYLPNRAL
jgi:putative two-component system hydrogenase maturation factor HypX/HoxX